MKNTLKLIFLFFSFILLSDVQPAFSFQLLPISRTFSPAGSGATQSYQVINDTQEKLAVEVSIVERQIDIAGQESHKQAEDDFLIYPPQILLNPGESQTVRVTWLGEPKPSKELAYRLVAEQLPINLEKPQDNQSQPVGTVKLLMRYLGSIYIRPTNVKQNVVLETIEPLQRKNGEKQLAITLHNQGTAHAVLKNLQLRLSAAGQKSMVNLKGEQLAAMNNAVILSGNKRRFIIPHPPELSTGAVTATLDFSRN
ncbi:molecular chaperone [Gloeocapsopsis crepidinum LEGE 06123]|uniref:Molecular chaperone n=1 Tax=Gloeocapsopsis crepidinum LEGE 06123 TaxID=588587 RepID=A0ABR9UTQ4_9CHRO|nr:fimbria/pilus periplasmic chaperone [Gloeocapsopsis crepidinum]MBE9191686.1 molecular chaperone [Gloeocapsopsis crepidinum LEGE 06123]